MSAVGFEPTRIAPPELESGALDHSAKVSCDSGRLLSWACGALVAAPTNAYIPYRANTITIIEPASPSLSFFA